MILCVFMILQSNFIFFNIFVILESDFKIEAELQSALKRSGIHYERAELGVKRNLEIIWRKLTGSS